MTVDSRPDSQTTRIAASEHLDAEGSVVKSGMALADATLKALEESGAVEISLANLKGASSSYFNVFLRRIEEECGLAEIGKHIHLQFGSKIQEMVYNRSFDARKPRSPATHQDAAVPAAPRQHWSILRWFGSLLGLLSSRK
jgi:hypothetical protein